MFERFAKARVVLLGEATHGTSEFYRARAQITRRLIEQHGFNIVAVEADWPDAARIDRYVRHKALHVGSGPAFRRFPQWMWRNVEVANFVDWLRARNAFTVLRRRALASLLLALERRRIAIPKLRTMPIFNVGLQQGFAVRGMGSRWICADCFSKIH